MSPESSKRGHRKHPYAPILHLARGGMGEVILALREEGEFRRLYALKRLLSTYRQDGELRSMFLEEARIAGLIRHPNVVSVLDVGEDDEGPFLVMDYVDGVSISRLIKRVAKQGQRISVQVVLKVIAETCKGLHAAHELRSIDGTPHTVVHRDVSPQNIIIGYDGVARVTDFGVAKVLDHIEQTRVSSLKGKQSYMSPEQLRFEELDRRSDLFSVGIVMFEMLAGRRLYKATDGVPAARKILTDAPPDLGEERSDLPPQLVALSFRLMAKDREKRPSTALEVADQLDALRAPLDVEHGVIDVGRYVSELFETERKEHADQITSAIEQYSSSIHVVEGQVAALRPPDATTSASPGPSRAPRAVLIKVSAVVVVAVALVVAGVAMSRGLTHDGGKTRDIDEPPGVSSSVESALSTGSRFDPDDGGPDEDALGVESDLACQVDGSLADEARSTDGSARRRHRFRRRLNPSQTSPTKVSQEPYSLGRYKIR